MMISSLSRSKRRQRQVDNVQRRRGQREKSCRLYFVKSKSQVVSRNNNNKNLGKATHDGTTNDHNRNTDATQRHWADSRDDNCLKEDMQQPSWHVKQKVARPHAKESTTTCDDCVLIITQVYNHDKRPHDMCISTQHHSDSTSSRVDQKNTRNTTLKHPETNALTKQS